MNLLRKIAKVADMAKNMRQKGKSARNGNAPSPYTKYHKAPYQYSAKYWEWRRSKTKPNVANMNFKSNNREKVREFKQAAE